MLNCITNWFNGIVPLECYIDRNKKFPTLHPYTIYLLNINSKSIIIDNYKLYKNDELLYSKDEPNSHDNFIYNKNLVIYSSKVHNFKLGFNEKIDIFLLNPIKPIYYEKLYDEVKSSKLCVHVDYHYKYCFFRKYTCSIPVVPF
jgi:hypothetical protein